MSTPGNPLTKYYTYAYHHILIACDTTEAAEALSTSNEFLDFVRNDEQVNTPEEPYGKYKPRDVNVGKGRQGRYSIIINGTTDASFVITQANWSTATAASPGGGNNFESFAVEGDFRIMEPRGVDFLNVMANVADFLQSDPSGLVFMLKTIFIGHKSATVSQDAYMDPIVNVRPVMLIIYDIAASFTVEGGVYDISWMGLNHGATKTKHIMHSADRISLNLSTAVVGCEANTLAGALCKLQSRINTIYDKYYNDVQKKVEAARDPQGNKIKFNGKKVHYIILAEDPYAKIISTSSNAFGKKMEGNKEYIVDQFKPQAKETGKKGEAGIVHLGSEPSVESAILQIAKRCSKIQADMNLGDDKESGEQIKFVPKVATTVCSDNDNYFVVYKLRRVMEARNDIVSRVLERKDDSTNKQDEDIRRNLLTLDYFFTGKNTDIINFDIKMEMGLAFFQTLVTTDNLHTNIEASQQTPQDNSNANATSEAVKSTATDKVTEPPKTRPGTPIFLSTKIDNKMLKNTANPKDTASFQSLLNRHAALENLEAVVTIHGNPNLLNATNKPPSEILNQLNKNQTQANASGDEPDVFPYWETTPAIVKLNIRMPTTEADPPYVNADISKPFWYEGFYYCFGIEHSFDSDGGFTQNLNLISLPNSSNVEKRENQQAKESSESEKTKADSQTSKQTTGGAGSVSTTNAANKSTQTNTKTTTEKAQETPPPAEQSPENLTVEEYLQALYKTNTPC